MSLPAATLPIIADTQGDAKIETHTSGDRGRTGGRNAFDIRFCPSRKSGISNESPTWCHVLSVPTCCAEFFHCYVRVLGAIAQYFLRSYVFLLLADFPVLFSLKNHSRAVVFFKQSVCCLHYIDSADFVCEQKIINNC